MDKPLTSVGFDITSAIRSDVALLYSSENTRVNATMKGTLAREPCQFYMLNYHRERMLDAAKAFYRDTSPLEGPEAFEELIQMLHDHLERELCDRFYPAPLKLRIAYSANGKFSITSDFTVPGAASIEYPFGRGEDELVSDLYPGSLSAVADNSAYLRWQVFVSSNKVTKSLFTTHKTSNREEYEKALAEAPALDDDHLQVEVLLVNRDEEVMEGCISTPYFKRGVNWITPQESCGGNLGTTRRWAVEKGLCQLGVVEIGSVKDGEIIVLSNGVKGFQAGIVDLEESSLDESSSDEIRKE